MKLNPVLIAFTFAVSSAGALAQQARPAQHWPSPEDIRQVAPALEKYANGLDLKVWARTGLTRRDRSLVTLATVTARGQAGALSDVISQALDNGIKPAEISETIVHLAFYSGFANAWAAIGPARDAFAKRGIGPDQLPKVTPNPLPMNEAAEADRAKRVSESFNEVSPSLVKDTTDFLFRDLWLRPDLAPRDRSLVTVSGLIANGQVGQVQYHLGRAMDNGLTREQAAEVVSHIAFYAGWPNAFSALPVVKSVIEARPK